MKRLWLIGIVCAVLLGLAASTDAQTIVSVNINKAKLVWDWTQGTGGTADEFRVKCGQTSGTYTKITSVAPTLRELAVSTAIAGNGNWFCVVTAANSFDESGPSSEVPFVAGVGPSSPSNLRLQAQ